LVKVNVHRRELADEGADILVDKAISDPMVGNEWCQRTNQAIFTWGNPCREAGKETYQDCHSTFDHRVSDAIRRGAVENEVQKHEEKLTGAWIQISTLRRRYERWCTGDDIEDCTHKKREQKKRDREKMSESEKEKKKRGKDQKRNQKKEKGMEGLGGGKECGC